jgi:hypothetical protein
MKIIKTWKDDLGDRVEYWLLASDNNRSVMTSAIRPKGEAFDYSELDGRWK